MSSKARRFGWVVATAMLAWVAAPVTAVAQDAVLYEVTENMYFYDAAGKLIPPDLILSGVATPAARVADATLIGKAVLGNPLCPSKLLLTNPKAMTCTVTAAGQDNISMATGKGTVSGTYAVVINIDNTVDAPEYVVQTGTFTGTMDLSTRPLGAIVGTFTPTGTTDLYPFTGKFRLPVRIEDSKRKDGKKGIPAYYVNDLGGLVGLQSNEFSLGTPLVKLELWFPPVGN